MADAAAAAPERPHKLDDLMIAMDVVDTIRHREDLVRRELNDEAREAEMIERLREIYRQQGIEVSDKMLAEGVKALKESRFTYRPQPPSFKRTLLEMWVRRRRYGAFAAVLGAIVLSTCSYEYFAVTRPAQIAEEQARIEVTQTLPAAIRRAHADIGKLTTDADARKRADTLLADAERAIADKDRAALARLSAEMTQLRGDITAEYTLTIVSRPGETTGVWRRPPRDSATRNYYLIVEPITPSGQKLKLPIRNEENGTTEIVDKFGVRVPRETFEAVSADKRDDGIVQRNRFGIKKRGTLVVDYLMPFDGGTITKW